MIDQNITKAVYPSGNPVPPSYCIMPDNYTTTVMVKIRTLTPLHESYLKDIIEKKLEVVSIETTEILIVVRNTERMTEPRESGEP